MKRYKVKRCRLKEIIHEKKKRQVDLVNDLGYSKTYINDKIRLRGTIRIDHAMTIAKYLGCSIEDLYEWEEVDE